MLAVSAVLFLNVACENQVTTPINPIETSVQKNVEGGIVIIVQGRTIEVDANNETGAISMNLKNDSGVSVYENTFTAPQDYRIDATNYSSGTYTLECTIDQNEVEIFEIELL